MNDFVVKVARTVFPILIGFFFFLIGCSKNTSEQGLDSTKRTSEKPNTTEKNPFKPINMVWISGGTFNMGSKHGKSDELPIHKVTVDGFWIDKTIPIFWKNNFIRIF